MRSTISLRSVAAVYFLGIVWCIVMVATGYALVDPTLSLAATLDVKDPAFATFGTMALAMLIATAVTVGLAVVIKWSTAPRQETSRA